MQYTEGFTLFPTKEMAEKRDIRHVALRVMKAERNVFQPAGNTEHEVCRSLFSEALKFSSA